MRPLSTFLAVAAALSLESRGMGKTTTLTSAPYMAPDPVMEPLLGWTTSGPAGRFPNQRQRRKAARQRGLHPANPKRR